MFLSTIRSHISKSYLCSHHMCQCTRAFSTCCGDTENTLVDRTFVDVCAHRAVLPLHLLLIKRSVVLFPCDAVEHCNWCPSKGARLQRSSPTFGSRSFTETTVVKPAERPRRAHFCKRNPRVGPCQWCSFARARAYGDHLCIRGNVLAESQSGLISALLRRRVLAQHVRHIPFIKVLLGACRTVCSLRGCGTTISRWAGASFNICGFCAGTPSTRSWW